MKYHLGGVYLTVLVLKMEKLLHGVVKFSNHVRPSLLPTLEKLANKAQVQFFVSDWLSLFNIVIKRRCFFARLLAINFHGTPWFLTSDVQSYLKWTKYFYFCLYIQHVCHTFHLLFESRSINCSKSALKQHYTYLNTNLIIDKAYK